MQSKLEQNAIIDRKAAEMINAGTVFGVSGDEVNGFTPDNEYDVDGGSARKGGNNTGAEFTHTHIPDLTSGGDYVDQTQRAKQEAYQISGLPNYTDSNPYPYTNIDTSSNVGQVVIY